MPLKGSNKRDYQRRLMWAKRHGSNIDENVDLDDTDLHWFASHETLPAWYITHVILPNQHDTGAWISYVQTLCKHTIITYCQHQEIHQYEHMFIHTYYSFNHTYMRLVIIHLSIHFVYSIMWSRPTWLRIDALSSIAPAISGNTGAGNDSNRYGGID